ncbi:MAG TPA: tetratricopeptide repeat protein, partial [Polyangiales bacterium]|nr:tetratricopeptide repeat protein [Polyangiales bacterium]
TVAGPAVAPLTAASEPAPVEAPALPGPRAFDVESLFDDKLEPERPASAASTDATNPKLPLGAAASDARRPQRAPRPPFTESWPLLAAAGVLALTVVGLASRACNSSDQQVASTTPEAPPPSAAGVAPAPQPAPVEQPAAAPSPAPAEPAPAPVAAAETSTAQPAEQQEELAQNDTPAQGRTLTAAQARPRGGVVPYHADDEPDVDYKARGRAYFSSGKYREAADSYQRASQRTPSDAGAFAGLGASWLAAGQTDRAISAYQRALQLKPDVSGFQAALGRAYLQKGDRGRASAAYRKALELDPKNSAAQRGLQSVQ